MRRSFYWSVSFLLLPNPSLELRSISPPVFALFAFETVPVLQNLKQSEKLLCLSHWRAKLQRTNTCTKKK